MQRHLTRIVFAAIALLCASLLGFAIYYLQEEVGLEPCPMCILQRYAFMAVGAIALVAAIHGPRGLALKVYSSLLTLFAIVGAGVAIRHSYLQHFPPKFETCGSDLEFLLGNFPLTKALPKIFAGTGSCSMVDWKFLGLSIPEWNIVMFAALAAVAIWLAFIRKPK